jgi:hypothetical protein
MAVTITTNCDTNRPLDCLLTCSPEKEEEAKDHSFDVDSIDPTVCVELRSLSLQNGDSSEPRPAASELRFDCDTHDICRLCIMAEMKRIEVFSANQFISTAEGELYDDFDGTKIYTFNIAVPGSQCVVLRIPGAWDTVWVFQIKAFTKEILPRSGGNFNLENVNSLLSNNIPLSKNAQSFKLLFENSQKSPMFPLAAGAGTGPPKFQDLLNNPAILGLASATMLAGKNAGIGNFVKPPNLPEQTKPKLFKHEY